MSKVKVVEIVEQEGVRYGQISHPNDLVQAQQYAHEHIEQITEDFLIQAAGEVVGGEISLGTGLTVSVADGRIYRGGLQYEFDSQNLTLDAAHEQFPRVDLIVAVLEENVPSNTELLAFQRLRSEQELNNSLAPYAPTQFQRFTERDNIATLAVKKGIPASSPQASVLAANEVALFEVTVRANAANLVLLDDVYDVRKIATNLRAINTQVQSLLSSIQELQRIVLVLKYRFPTIVSGDGRCPAMVHQDASGNYVIDIPIGTLVEFGDRFVYVEPETTQSAVNPRRITASNAATITYQSLFEGENIEPTHPRAASTDNSTTGNVVRIDAPTSRKWLYLSHEGDLFFRSDAQPSNGNQCLLLRVDPVQDSAPTIKTYRNLRNSITSFSKTYVSNDPTTKQFETDVAMPNGYIYGDAFAIKASSGERYQIPTPFINFDSVVTVDGVTPGDKWIVNVTVLSAL